MWSGKRYRSLNHDLRERFGEKVMKISLDGGFSCPNRDGTLSFDGCIFCSERGSGDFAGDRLSSLTEQFETVRRTLSDKWTSGKYIAYFQAFTNTYDTPDRLRERYEEALAQPGVVGLAIATRPDCLSDGIIALLQELSQRTYLWVELGLQTCHDETARRINRGYDRSVYESAMERLTRAGIEAVTHVIFGLPGETREDMLETVRYVRDQGSRGVKFHLLHLMRHTPLESVYQSGGLRFLEEAEYITLICDAIGLLSPDMVVHRLTGDSPRELLIGPMWSLKKWEILNAIDSELTRRDIIQGSLREEIR
ncbi:TIGR01212 family radical SAM protein [Proteiniclasticum sp. QWL-01]|uniref:TIGR01212 family radical SAM protein n=1 Tax=Proteiniclasticum sp. QWL-01 TaxID=3036945 RepID=UPI00220F2A46|nr:TIGR01212 family radical SAM protein [Proteiniclasticum sp. QWL-01]UUM11258.1 TIGR01212 family radical SAM protein [Clostridiaceae bacterium HFYG-1003]WFF72596.1 TIGR01212 family radical SAM protein [Proteiniclasticum sp. QWL-01]